MPEAGRLERSRYIKVTWRTDRQQTSPIAGEEIFQLISSNLRLLFGIKGSVAAGLYLVNSNQSKNDPLPTNANPFIIIRCSHRFVVKLFAAIVFCREYEGYKLCVWSTATSGTIKKILA